MSEVFQACMRVLWDGRIVLASQMVRQSSGSPSRDFSATPFFPDGPISSALAASSTLALFLVANVGVQLLNHLLLLVRQRLWCQAICPGFPLIFLD